MSARASGVGGLQRGFLWVCCVMVGVETAPPIRRTPPTHDGPKTHLLRIGWRFQTQESVNEVPAGRTGFQKRPLSVTPSAPNAAATWDESWFPANSR